MKKNDLIQIKGSDLKELRLKVKTLKTEVANLVLDKNMKKLKDLKMISKRRKDLAQILTIIGQKESLEKLESRVEQPKASLVKDGSQESTEDKSKEGGKS